MSVLRALAAVLLLGTATPVGATPNSVGQVNFQLNPVLSTWRWESNVRRDPRGSRSDGIWIFSTGAETTFKPQRGKFWEGRLDYTFSGGVYGRESDLDSVQNDFNLATEVGPDPLKLILAKLYSIRRSRLPDWDYWDDGYRGELRWTDPRSRTSAGLLLDRVSRSYFDRTPVVTARQNQLTRWGLNLDGEIFPGLNFNGKTVWSIQDYNRYAVGEGAEGLWVMPVLQQDRDWRSEVGLRWFHGRLLQQASLYFERVRSNTVGFSSRVRGFAWAGVWKPIPKLYLEGLARMEQKHYDREPLPLPEFNRGWPDEEGGKTLSFRLTWSPREAWKSGIGYSWLRAESNLMDRYYQKRRVELTLQRLF